MGHAHKAFASWAGLGAPEKPLLAGQRMESRSRKHFCIRCGLRGWQIFNVDLNPFVTLSGEDCCAGQVRRDGGLATDTVDVAVGDLVTGGKLRNLFTRLNNNGWSTAGRSEVAAFVASIIQLNSSWRCHRRSPKDRINLS